MYIFRFTVPQTQFFTAQWTSWLKKFDLITVNRCNEALNFLIFTCTPPPLTKYYIKVTLSVCLSFMADLRRSVICSSLWHWHTMFGAQVWMSRVLRDDEYKWMPCTSRCGKLKNPHCSMVVSAKHMSKLQPFAVNGNVSKWLKNSRVGWTTPNRKPNKHT